MRKCAFRGAVILLMLLVLSATAFVRVFSGSEVYPLTRWVIPPDEIAEGESLSLKNGMAIFHYSYDTGKPSGLFQPVNLTEFRKIRISLFSLQPTALVLILHDRNGGGFHYAHPVAGGVETDLIIHPSDFQPNDDSPVKGKELDPERLGSGFILVDPNLMRHQGENMLRVDSATIEYEPIPQHSGNLVVDEPATISESSERFGDILIKPGGHLIITAPRFVLHGSVECDGGSLELVGGTMVIPERFEYERHFKFSDGGQFKITDGGIDSVFSIGVELHNSAILARNASFMPIVTLGPDERSKVRLEKFAGATEIVIPPTEEEVSVADSKGVILWLVLGPNMRRELTLPASDKETEEWNGARYGLNLRVHHSSVTFTMISVPGTNTVIRNTNIMAVGLVFSKNEVVSLDNLQNGERMRDYRLPHSDRNLRFVNSRVHTWSFYPNAHARLKVTNSTFGEAVASDQATVEFANSVCDGSGGYVNAEGESHLRLSNCEVRSNVIAREHATIILENCRVQGDVIAIGDSTIKLDHTRVAGRIEKEGNARLIRMSN